MRMGATFALVLILAGPLAAEPPDAARLYASGQYLAAADAADDARASADTFAFAAHALLAACLIGGAPEQTEDLLERAERRAREAIALDSGAVEARLQLALVYGISGRRASVAEAIARNYAPRGRRLIEQALALSPEHARAHALLGAWHLEVLRRGGSAGALAYGARFAEGVAASERALELAPDDPMIPLHYSIALLELDARVNSARAAELLALNVALAPRDAFERRGQRIGADLALILAEQGPRAAAMQAGRLSP